MLDQDLQSIQAARDLVEAAHRAQAIVASFDQAKIDAICEAMATAAQQTSMRLAQLAHDVEPGVVGLLKVRRDSLRIGREP